MKLQRRLQRPMPETIVALIDVVFFLLVFFMLVGRMDATSPFDVAPPQAVLGSDMPGGGATLSVAADGRIALDGTEISQAELGPRVADLLAQDPELLVRVNAHKSTSLRYVLPHVTVLENLGVRDVVFVVTPEPL